MKLSNLFKIGAKNIAFVLSGAILGTGLIAAVSASDAGYTYYLDSDSDGFGDLTMATTTDSEIAPAGYVAVAGDCDDSDSEINPDASEVCDGLDNNCADGIDEGVLNTYYFDGDGDLFGTASSTKEACSAPAFFVASSTDCNDLDKDINPNAEEVYDGVDNNCNGDIDEGIESQIYYRDNDGDGYGDPTAATSSYIALEGYVLIAGDCNDEDASTSPAVVEIAGDGIDNNCNGDIDETIQAQIYYRDNDGDGYGDPAVATSSYVAVDGYVLLSGDCNDEDASTSPAALEIANDGIDNNCDGILDEDVDPIVEEPGDYGDYFNHGAYVSAWAHFLNQQKQSGEISGREKGQKMREVAQSKKKSKKASKSSKSSKGSSKKSKGKKSKK